MKVTYEDMKASGMLETFGHVYERGQFAQVGDSYRVLKIKRVLDQAVKTARQEFKDLLKEHVVHENGEPAPSPDGAFKLVNDTPEGREAFEKIAKEFHLKEVDLGELKPIALNSLPRSLNLTPRQLDSLIPFLSGVEALD